MALAEVCALVRAVLIVHGCLVHRKHVCICQVDCNTLLTQMPRSVRPSSSSVRKVLRRCRRRRQRCVVWADDVRLERLQHVLHRPFPVASRTEGAGRRPAECVRAARNVQ